MFSVRFSPKEYSLLVPMGFKLLESAMLKSMENMAKRIKNTHVPGLLKTCFGFCQYFLCHYCIA